MTEASPGRRRWFQPVLAWSAPLITGALTSQALMDDVWSAVACVSLVPLFLVLHSAASATRAATLGLLAGAVFGARMTWVLSTAHVWTGWATGGNATQLAVQQQRFLLWIPIGISLVVGVVWAAFGFLFWKKRKDALWMVGAIALWMVGEKLLSGILFGFTWGYVGNALGPFDGLRQLAAMGGVSLLSAFVVALNAGLTQLIQTASQRRLRMLAAPAMIFGATAICWGFGAWRCAQAGTASFVTPWRAAALQHHAFRYTLEDFLPFGLDRAYVSLAHDAVSRGSQLLVLPESVSVRALNLDNSHSPTKPPVAQVPRSSWDNAAQAALRNTRAVFVAGLDTIEDGKDYNSLGFWTERGLAGTYHKRELVPFAERSVAGFDWLLRGQSLYSSGTGSQIVRWGPLRLGAFICQEVWFPQLVRRSIEEGANVLVSGANDAVTQGQVLARMQANAARIRAVEAGRYLVRASKGGRSAVIDPYGVERVHSQTEETASVEYAVEPWEGLTPYVRGGDWPLWLAAAFTLHLLLREFTK